MRSFVAPGLSLNSFSFMVQTLKRQATPPLALFRIQRHAVFLDDAYQMWKFVDHAANGGVIHHDLAAVHFVQPQTDKRFALVVGPADRAADLLIVSVFFTGASDIMRSLMPQRAELRQRPRHRRAYG